MRKKIIFLILEYFYDFNISKNDNNSSYFKQKIFHIVKSSEVYSIRYSKAILTISLITT